MWQKQVPAAQLARQGPRPSCQVGVDLFPPPSPPGRGRHRPPPPRQLGLQGQLGRHSCFQVSSSKSNHMRIYNPSWGLGSISLNSLAPEMQVSLRGTGSISPSK